VKAPDRIGDHRDPFQRVNGIRLSMAKKSAWTTCSTTAVCRSASTLKSCGPTFCGRFGAFFAACAITLIFADKVVEILTWPLQGKLEAWHKNRLDTLSAD